MRYFVLPSEVGKVETSKLSDRITRRRELEEGYDGHDCHASEEDGCFACGEWAEYNEELGSMVAAGHEADFESQEALLTNAV